MVSREMAVEEICDRHGERQDSSRTHHISRLILPVELAREVMDVLASVQTGDTIAPEWISQRDDVVRRAGRFLSDVPLSSGANLQNSVNFGDSSSSAMAFESSYPLGKLFCHPGLSFCTFSITKVDGVPKYLTDSSLGKSALVCYPLRRCENERR